MINPKELRIGNIIYCTTNKLNVIVQWPHPAEVVINVLWPDGGGCEHVHADLQECEPIVLNHEWLERLGFEKKDYKYQDGSVAEGAYVKGRFIVRLIKIGDDESYRTEWTPYWPEHNGLPGNMKFVHQLQNNYYWWTNGQELTFNNVNLQSTSSSTC